MNRNFVGSIASEEEKTGFLFWHFSRPSCLTNLRVGALHWQNRRIHGTATTMHRHGDIDAQTTGIHAWGRMLHTCVIVAGRRIRILRLTSHGVVVGR
jgi:hypothetical protein